MNTTHGQNGTKVYRAWENMRARCLNHNTREFPRYGGRGIRVCERWMAFVNFYADIGDPPSPEHSIERLDVNGHYEPGNVIWGTQEQQDNNRRTTRRITAFGETKSVAQWSRDARCVVTLNTLRGRIRRGCDPVAAMQLPPMTHEEGGRIGGLRGAGKPR